ncbi:helix-turn-helix domain-containing protein [Labrys sp. KB_33_2]|uniref:helix-turn-helix domain-containing protein n=1 Tax=Labrys sp. KB_33_2 TaxID=3237479 RepID=UPI003F92D12C
MKKSKGKGTDGGPPKSALTVTSDLYYRMRADTQRSLKRQQLSDSKSPPARARSQDAAERSLLSMREDMGLSREKLASLAGVSVADISRIEDGDTGLPLSIYLKLSEILNVSVDQFKYDRRKY